MRDIRVFYHKKDVARYVSHLDINRCMQRALGRAGISVWYTQGFNPHMYITFALPTPLGYESECETMDLRITDDMTDVEIAERLNATLPRGLWVERVAVPVHKAEEITAAQYRVVCTCETIKAAAAAAMVQRFFEQDAMPVEKKTKKGTKVVDLKPLCTLCGLNVSGDTLTLDLRLAAGGSTNINPSLVLEALTKSQNLTPDGVQVLKQQVFLENGAVFA